jgi:hypothetical protein
LLPQWTRPAVAASGDAFLINDGRGTIYSVAVRTQGQPQLAQVAAAATSGPVASPLVNAGGTAIGIVRHESSDAIAGFGADGQAAFEPLPLAGRWQAGPFAAGGLVLLTAEPEGLLCVESGGKLRWQQPLAAGPLAGAPLPCDGGDLLILHQSGIVRRIDAVSGEELARHDVQQPLSGPARILGPNLFLAGSDGVVHRIPLPTKP